MPRKSKSTTGNKPKGLPKRRSSAAKALSKPLYRQRVVNVKKHKLLEKETNDANSLDD